MSTELSKDVQIQKPIFINSKLVEDPAKILGIAQDILSPQKFAAIQTYVNRIVIPEKPSNISDVARSIGLSRDAFYGRVLDAKTDIANHLGLDLHGPNIHAIKNEIGMQGKVERLKTGESDITNLFPLVERFISRAILNHSNLNPDLFHDAVLSKLTNSFMSFEWKGYPQFVQFIRTRVYWTAIDMERRNNAALNPHEKAYSDVKNDNIPKDILDSWIDSRSIGVDLLFSGLSEDHDKLYWLSRDGLSTKEMANKMSMKTTSIKATLSTIRRDMLKASGIKVPDGYINKLPGGLIERIKAGAINEVVLLNKRYYVPERILKNYLAGEIPPPRKKNNSLNSNEKMLVKEVLEEIPIHEDLQTTDELTESSNYSTPEEQIMAETFDTIIEPLYKYSYANLHDASAAEAFINSALNLIGSQIRENRFKGPVPKWFIQNLENFRKTNKVRLAPINKLYYLKDQQRIILTLSRGAGLGYDQIANTLGLSQKKVADIGLKATREFNKRNTNIIA